MAMTATQNGSASAASIAGEADPLRTRKREEQLRLQEGWRGRLNKELWTQDASRESYVATASDLEVEFAKSPGVGDPLPKEATGIVGKLLPAAVPHHASPPIADGVRTAYLVSFGETWDDLDPERARQIALECCEAAASNGMPEANEGRWRSGSALTGLVSCHPEHSRPLTAFQPLYDYFDGLSSFQRLRETGPHFASQFVAAFFGPLDPDDEAELRQSYALAWHLGMATWLWWECGFLKRPDLAASNA